MNFWFLSAAILSAFTCALHLFLGGREAARPLLATIDLDRVAKFTNYYCRHLVTIGIALLAAAFAFASMAGANTDLALFASASALTFASWSICMIIRHQLPPFQFAQWALFLPIGCLGMVGLAGW